MISFDDMLDNVCADRHEDSCMDRSADQITTPHNSSCKAMLSVLFFIGNFKIWYSIDFSKISSKICKYVSISVKVSRYIYYINYYYEFFLKKKNVKNIKI